MFYADVDGYNSVNQTLKLFVSNTKGFMPPKVSTIPRHYWTSIKKSSKKSKSNRKKYCPQCAKEIEKENGKKRFNKWYEKHKKK